MDRMVMHHEQGTEPLGRRLERARGYAGLSKSDMAARLGVDRKTIYNWETGATVPTIDVVLAYGQLAGFPTSFFTDGLSMTVGERALLNEAA